MTRNKALKKRVFTVAIPLVAAALMITGLFLLLRDATSQDGGNVYTYFLQRQDYPNATIRLNTNNETEIVSGDTVVTASNIPIYSADTKKIILPKSMVYYCPVKSMEPFRAEALSEIYVDEASGVLYYVTHPGESEPVQLSGGFLYDGADLFLFLEPCTLEINNTSEELSAFSYVEGSLLNGVFFLDYDSQRFFTETGYIEGKVNVTAANGTFKLSVLDDSIQVYTSLDGKAEKYLLFTRPDVLEIIK